MTPTQEIIMIFGMMLVTFGVRYPVLAIMGQLELPRQVLRALRFVPVAVLTAITIPIMLAPTGITNITPTNAYLVAGGFAIGVSWYSKNLLLTIVLGMGMFFLWQILTG